MKYETGMKKKLIRTAAIPESLVGLLTGQLKFLNQYYEVVGVASHGKALQHIEENEGTVPVNIEQVQIEPERSPHPEPVLSPPMVGESEVAEEEPARSKSEISIERQQGSLF